jgi:hypothetical protein
MAFAGHARAAPYTFAFGAPVVPSCASQITHSSLPVACSTPCQVFNSRGTAQSPVLTPQFYSASYTDDTREVSGHRVHAVSGARAAANQPPTALPQ